MDSKYPFTLRIPITLSLSKGEQLRASTSSARTIFFVLAFLAALPAQAAEVRGQVRLDGPLPKREKVVIEPKKGGSHSTQGCGSLIKDSQRLQVDAEGGVRNAVVWLELPGEAGPETSGPALINQNRCVFEPHGVAIPAGGEIAVRNSDEVIHNVRIFREGKPDMLMRRWQKADAPDIRWRFNEPGRYTVRCGVHPWMYAWVFVTPGGRAAVTDEKGRFTLSGVPAGPHTLRVWHETLGTREVPVRVKREGTELQPIHYRRGF